MLFGEKPKYKEMIDLIQPGHCLFLYNVDTEQLFGEFEATSIGEENIVPEAWGGGFPLQVSVQWKQKHDKVVTKKDFVDVVRFLGPRDRQPSEFLTHSQVQELQLLFVANGEHSSDELEFRKKFRATTRTDDGHFVRSFGEYAIDNWLFKQELVHGYERKVPTAEALYCDFFLPIPSSKEVVYLEFWGKEDEEYMNRKQRKKQIYAKYSLSLVELEPKDIETLDDVLPARLRQYFPNRKFF